MVPFNDLKRQYQGIEKEILAATKRVYEKGRYILGEEVSAFEKEFARYCGVRYGVGVGSGTEALYLSLKASGIGEGDEVITSANSFISTAFAISFTGAKPLFVDIDYQTYTMDPDGLELLLKRRMAREGWERVKAVLPVHLYGHPAEMGSILEIANRYNLLVIEDACKAHGAKYGEKKVGSFGAFGCFSFYPTKIITTLEGGMLVTDNDDIAKRAKILREHGMTRSAVDREKGAAWYYDVIDLGYNYRLNEVQAALGTSQLKRLGDINRLRVNAASQYTARLKEIDGIVTPYEAKDRTHSYHLYVIRVLEKAFGISRNQLFMQLSKKNIGLSVHYTPLHLLTFYQNLLHHSIGDFPVAERIYNEILSLPIFPMITENQIYQVVSALKLAKVRALQA